jgi:hypothetical protein
MQSVAAISVNIRGLSPSFFKASTNTNVVNDAETQLHPGRRTDTLFVVIIHDANGAILKLKPVFKAVRL